MRAARIAVTALGLLAAWQAVVWATGVPGFILPGPAAVGRALAANASLLASHARITLVEILLGIGLGTDPIPEQVLFIRSDHFSFVRQGVPSLFIKSGFQTGDPAKDGSAINAGYRRDVYHKPNDDMSQAFDFEAGASHAKVNFLTGWQVAQTTARPAWNPGDFFGTLFGSTPAAGTGAK